MKILYHPKHVAKHLFPNSLFLFLSAGFMELFFFLFFFFFPWLLFLNVVSYFRRFEKSICPGSFLRCSWFTLWCFFFFFFSHMLTPRSHFTARWCTVRTIKPGLLEMHWLGFTSPKTRLCCTITALILCPEISEVLLYCKSSCVYLFVSWSDP